MEYNSTLLFPHIAVVHCKLINSQGSRGFNCSHVLVVSSKRICVEMKF
uniref:Uncharacterized protein n=1 Tax=Manihot esculenta TaxID=3983 RepID=A0A2C9WIE2_MANES